MLALFVKREKNPHVKVSSLEVLVVLRGGGTDVDVGGSMLPGRAGNMPP